MYDVTQQVFHELSDSVLRNRATEPTSGWKQVHVYVRDVLIYK